MATAAKASAERAAWHPLTRWYPFQLADQTKRMEAGMVDRVGIVIAPGRPAPWADFAETGHGVAPRQRTRTLSLLIPLETSSQANL